MVRRGKGERLVAARERAGGQPSIWTVSLRQGQNMCWHVRERVLVAEPIKVAPQVEDLSFIAKDRSFLFRRPFGRRNKPTLRISVAPDLAAMSMARVPIVRFATTIPTISGTTKALADFVGQAMADPSSAKFVPADRAPREGQRPAGTPPRKD